MTKHVYSTLSADMKYTDWVTQPGVSTVEKQVLVRGGAGVATSGNGPNIITPKGVRTEVTDEDAEFLSNHGMFKFHQERGHVKIENRPLDAEKVAQKMDSDTGGGPKTPDDVRKDADDAAKKTGLTPTETLNVVTNKGK